MTEVLKPGGELNIDSYYLDYSKLRKGLKPLAVKEQSSLIMLRDFKSLTQRKQNAFEYSETMFPCF